MTEINRWTHHRRATRARQLRWATRNRWRMCSHQDWESIKRPSGSPSRSARQQSCFVSAAAVRNPCPTRCLVCADKRVAECQQRPGRHLVAFAKVAKTGLVPALPLSLSARPKRKSDRGRHEARHERSFVGAALSDRASRVAQVAQRRHPEAWLETRASWRLRTAGNSGSAEPAGAGGAALME